MTTINCKLFGTISIKEDGEDVFIPSGKISGLFFYILSKKVVSRDEVAGLFWAFSNDERARTSLRNALHKLKKCFKSDVILSPNKSTLVLNEDLEYDIDVGKFEKDPINNLELYTGEFLKGFYVNDVVDFEYWVTEKRTQYEELFSNNIQKKIVRDFENGNLENIRTDIYNLLSIDNYNETAYKYLFKYYHSKGRYDKVINEYHNLKDLLDKELGISPSEDIKSIYNDALKKIEVTSAKDEGQNKKFLYKREYELKLMQKNIDDFAKGIDSKSVLLIGESGIGKSELKNRIISDNKDNFTVYETNCLRVEKEFAYSTWIKIIREIGKDLENKHIYRINTWSEMKKKLFFEGGRTNLSFGNIAENKENFNKNLIFNSLLTAFEELSVDKKILIVIGDLQWADNLSIKLLINLIIQANKNIMFLISSTEEINKSTTRLMDVLKTLNKIETITLKRFNKSEVLSIVRQAFKDKEVKEEIADSIYEKSQGNTFLLQEYINLYLKNENEKLISSKMYSLFHEKFANLEEVEIKLLQVISAYYGESDINSLLKVTGLKAFDVIDSISNLVRMDIIKENAGEDFVSIEFTNKVYKEYIYSTLPESAKCVLHEEIAKTLEGNLKNIDNDITIYIKLQFHYERANDMVKSLHYEICILNYYLNFNHEIFPNLDDYDISHQVKLHIKNDKALNWINDIENKILKVKNNNRSRDEDIRQSERLFSSMKGRYLIRCGNYTEGVKVINNVIKMAKAEKDYLTQLYGHKQMAIYGIQINDPDIMETHIMEGIKVANKINSKSDIGVLYRLYGVNNLMRGKFNSALELFEKSISLLAGNGTLENPNSISVAANYNYIGEIRNAEEDFTIAMQYYNMAISLCKHTEASCLSIFYINAGKTSFLMNNIEDMKRYLMLSKEKVNEFDSYWKKSVIDAFIALLNFLEGDYESSLVSLRDAVVETKTINNPRDIGMVYFVQTIIKVMIDDGEDLKDLSLKNILDEPLEMYFYKAMNYLDPFRDNAEINYLKSKVNSR